MAEHFTFLDDFHNTWIIIIIYNTSNQADRVCKDKVNAQLYFNFATSKEPSLSLFFFFFFPAFGDFGIIR